MTQSFTDRIIEKTQDYLSIPSVVGHEDIFLRYLEEDFRSLGLHAVRHEGVLEIHGSQPGSNIVCAHVDRHGLIALGDNQYAYAAQYMKEIKYGVQNVTSQAELKNLVGRFEGEAVKAYDPTTGRVLGHGFIQTCRPCLDQGDALFMIEGMEGLEENTPIAYARPPEFENDYFKGQIDNAICVAMVYALFDSGYKGTALLTIEEEIGKSWTHIASYLESHGIETDSLIVLDTSPYVDADPVKDGMIIFRNRDISAKFNAAQTKKMAAAAKSMGLRYHMKDEYLLSLGKPKDKLGSTELGKLIKNTEGRWSGTTLQIPTLMYHTSRETTSRKAIDNYFRFLHEILVGSKGHPALSSQERQLERT